jgi:hypothetical protein
MFLPKFSVSSVAALALLASGTAFAQFADVNQNPTGVEGTTIPGSGDLLWDNTSINSGTNGIVSLQAADQPAGANIVQTADDFTVPAGETWNIDFVYSEGFSNAPTDPNAFGVHFFADAGGLPGALIAERTVPFGGNVTLTNQELGFAAVSLSEGSYWVSVFGIYDPFVDLGTTRWNWTTGNGVVGNQNAALQDTGSFFGSPLSWSPLGDLGVTDSESVLFALRGSTVTGPTLPPPASVPTMNTWGLLALALGLMLGGAFAMRKRFQ